MRSSKGKSADSHTEHEIYRSPSSPQPRRVSFSHVIETQVIARRDSEDSQTEVDDAEHEAYLQRAVSQLQNSSPPPLLPASPTPMHEEPALPAPEPAPAPAPVRPVQQKHPLFYPSTQAWCDNNTIQVREQQTTIAVKDMLSFLVNPMLADPVDKQSRARAAMPSMLFKLRRAIAIAIVSICTEACVLLGILFVERKTVSLVFSFVVTLMLLGAFAFALFVTKKELCKIVDFPNHERILYQSIAKRFWHLIFLSMLFIVSGTIALFHVLLISMLNFRGISPCPKGFYSGFMSLNDNGIWAVTLFFISFSTMFWFIGETMHRSYQMTNYYYRQQVLQSMHDT